MEKKHKCEGAGNRTKSEGKDVIVDKMHEHQRYLAKQKVIEHNYKTEINGDNGGISKEQSGVNKLPFVIDVLTDAKALLDYNDQISKTLSVQVAKETVPNNSST